MCVCITPCISLCGNPYVSMHSSSSLAVCKCAPRSADFDFIMAHMMQRYRKPKAPAVPDMVLSAAFCLRFVGMKTGLCYRGQAGQHDTGRQGGREEKEGREREVEEIHQGFTRPGKMLILGNKS